MPFELAEFWKIVPFPKGWSSDSAKRLQTIMGFQTDSTRDTRGESAKSGNLYATRATCESPTFGCNLLNPLVDLKGFEPSTS